MPNWARCYPSFEIGFGDGTSATAESSAFDLRISLNNTREFGMVLSAGMGGPDADLDESNFRKDRASVHAAAELTDAGDFLGLFRRTLAYQRLARADRRLRMRNSRPASNNCLRWQAAMRRAIRRPRSCCAAWN